MNHGSTWALRDDLSWRYCDDVIEIAHKNNVKVICKTTHQINYPMCDHKGLATAKYLWIQIAASWPFT